MILFCFALCLLMFGLINWPTAIPSVRVQQSESVLDQKKFKDTACDRAIFEVIMDEYDVKSERIHTLYRQLGISFKDDLLSFNGPEVEEIKKLIRECLDIHKEVHAINLRVHNWPLNY